MEELVDGAKVNRKRINFTVMRGVNLMDVGGKLRKAINILPDFFVGSMEEVGTVFMTFDTGGGIKFRIAVTADVIALINN